MKLDFLSHPPICEITIQHVQQYQIRLAGTLYTLCNIFCFMNCAGKIVSTLVDLKLFEDYITSSFFSFNNQAMAVWLFD
jgi:hypothetical protein